MLAWTGTQWPHSEEHRALRRARSLTLRSRAQRGLSKGGQQARALLGMRGMRLEWPHPEEHRAAMRLEGWERARCLLPILRDAALWAAPQDEACFAAGSELQTAGSDLQ